MSINQLKTNEQPWGVDNTVTCGNDSLVLSSLFMFRCSDEAQMTLIEIQETASIRCHFWFFIKHQNFYKEKTTVKYVQRKNKNL